MEGGIDAGAFFSGRGAWPRLPDRRVDHRWNAAANMIWSSRELFELLGRKATGVASKLLALW